jgi:hypothetical protein
MAALSAFLHKASEFVFLSCVACFVSFQIPALPSNKKISVTVLPGDDTLAS